MSTGMSIVQQVVQHVVVKVELSGEVPNAYDDGKVGSGKCTSLS